MTVNKMSVSFAPELDEAIRSAASEAGQPLSTWLAEAAAARLRTEALSAYLVEWQREHGTITDVELARADAELGLTAKTSAA